MANYRLYKSATYAADWLVHGDLLTEDIKNNPGTTLGEIAVRLRLSTDLVERLLTTLDETGFLQRAHDIAGNEYLWTSAVFSNRVLNKMVDARNWVQTNDGKTVAQMAKDLRIHEAIAIKIAFMLKAEGDVRLTPLL